MIPLKQTIFSNPEGTVHGNCFPTCIACILDLQISDIPLLKGSDWFIELYYFLRERGYEYIGTPGFDEFHESIKNKIYYPPFQGVDGYYIVGGKSHRTYVDRGHSVIFKEGKMVHDPHPDNNGLLTYENVYWIEKGK
jgi:hypothetical protein